MPRFPRNFISTIWYHVIVQGINKSYIFENNNDKNYYISSMLELQNNCKINIIAYCIMDNHAHLLIETEKVCNLSQYMHKLNTKYGKYYNSKYQRVGYVFRDRYKSEGIYSYEHLYNCMYYIYNNPVKARLCKNLEEYSYSNYKKGMTLINDNFKFIDIEESQDEKFDRYILENEIDLKNIKDDKIKLKKIVLELKRDNGMSLRKIAEKLDINREIIRKMYVK